MTLSIERARSRRPVTWLTVLGVLLLPVVIGAILVAALYNPTERLEGMTAAIVNEDEPVTIDGQYTPLGRQLAAGLVAGSDEAESNLTWVLSNADDAAEGLADGRYHAVITIPEAFSSAATSAGQSLSGAGSAPEQATIEVTTPPDARILDDAITAQVAQAATTALGSTISETTLENVFLGFTTLGDQLGDAASGAAELADGAGQAADGAAKLPAGATALADGAGQLASGAGSLSSGLTTLAGKTREAAAGAGALVQGVQDGAAQIEQNGIVPSQLTDLATGAAAAGAAGAQSAGQAAQDAGAAAQTAGGVATDLGALAASCTTSGASAEFCAQVQTVAGAAQTAAGSAGAAAQSAGTAAEAAVATATAAGYTSGGLAQFAQAAPGQLAGQLRGIADQARPLGDGLTQLAGGIDQAAAGAADLGTGADRLGAGAGELATGAQSLADGVRGIADGTTTLADGLDSAVTELPSYSDDEASTLAQVVSTPVSADSADGMFGSAAIPLLTALALWFGGLASYIAMQAATRRALTERRSSVALTLRAFLPGAAIGAAQGLLVALVVQMAAGYETGTWWAFAGLSVLAGVAFAAVNQALVAVLGGAGRWVGALVGVLLVATGVVSTVPGALTGLAGLLPTTPATTALLGVLTDAGGVAAGVSGLLVWTVLSLIATTVAVSLRRTAAPRSLLAPSPA